MADLIAMAWRQSADAPPEHYLFPTDRYYFRLARLLLENCGFGPMTPGRWLLARAIELAPWLPRAEAILPREDRAMQGALVNHRADYFDIEQCRSTQRLLGLFSCGFDKRGWRHRDDDDPPAYAYAVSGPPKGPRPSPLGPARAEVPLERALDALLRGRTPPGR